MLRVPFIKYPTRPPNATYTHNTRIVIAYSLYGNANGYLHTLVENCKIINTQFPEFWIYIFIGDDFNHTIMSILNTFSNIHIIKTGLVGHKNMAMRFTAIDYPEVGIAFSRDCDSMINRRDQYCIRKFIESDKKFQIIRDNITSHYAHILGGMWGIKKGLLNFKIIDKINEYYNQNIVPGYGDDQTFLRIKIYPFVRDFSQVFDEFFQFPGEYPEKINTGIPYTTRNHVGAAWFGSDAY
jgi:hypothetical protein